MKNTLTRSLGFTFALSTALLASTASFAANSELDIVQVGSSNYASQVIDGNSNAGLHQEGNSNQATTNISIAGISASSQQYGNGNVTTNALNAYGSQFTTYQGGNLNQLNTTVAGALHQINAQQRGDGNYMKLTIDGAENRVNVSQAAPTAGVANSAEIELGAQSYQNAVNVNQDGNSYAHVLIGAGSVSNQATISQLQAYGNSAELLQTGNYNYGEVQQNGATNSSARIEQQGDSNYGQILQNNADNSHVSLTQIGNGHGVVIDQTGTHSAQPITIVQR